MYYYVIDEYRVSNELLTEDIYVRLPSVMRCDMQLCTCSALVANTSTGTAICGTADRKLRKDARREGGRAEKVNKKATMPYACTAYMEDQAYFGFPRLEHTSLKSSSMRLSCIIRPSALSLLGEGKQS